MSLHLEAKEGEIAERVLLPGDPLRAKYMAEKFLENPVCYNKVRGMLGYTGLYKGKRVSIQGTGMGMGSSGIYVTELIENYKVKTLIRVGTCGTLQADVELGQVVLGVSASGDCNANRLYFKGIDFAPSADFQLLYKAYEKAKELGISTIEGGIFSTDMFYDYGEKDRWAIWAQHGIVGIDMESQMLYTLAARYGAKALSLLTVSDNLPKGESISAQDREQGVADMMKIAFEIV